MSRGSSPSVAAVTQGSPRAPHWASHAGRWQHVGGPLRPSAEDIACLGRWIRPLAKQRKPLDALLLGVTPEIAQLELTPRWKLVAIDQSDAMIAHVWPGDTAARRARLGDWLALPLADASQDLAIGDGCLTLFDFPDGYRSFARSLARVLRPGAHLALRVYSVLEHVESVDQVFDALWSGRIGNFHVFKWRLAMALTASTPARTVELDAIWRAYAARVPEPSELAIVTGFPLSEVLTMDSYRGSSDVYTFPRTEDVISVLEPELALRERYTGGYELAERCPQLWLERRGA